MVVVVLRVVAVVVVMIIVVVDVGIFSVTVSAVGAVRVSLLRYS